MDSEFRLYHYIQDSLEIAGWDTRSPSKGGQVYTQNEIYKDDILKSALGRQRPENVVVVGPKIYWVIEAKRSIAELEKAVAEAKQYAAHINSVEEASCPIVTGIAGSVDSTRYIDTYLLVDDKWKPLIINGRRSTGFISLSQVEKVLESGNATLDEYDIEDRLFVTKSSEINTILHDGGINKRNRAGVLSCLLLALAEDERMPVSDDPTTLISDINTRAKRQLKHYGKDTYFPQIEIHLPPSNDNHTKHKNALKRSVEILRELNIASAINSGRDVLGQFYEGFLKYANDAREIGIVLTPRNITTFAAEIVNVQRNDIVFDPACGTGGFLVAALDKVRKSGVNVEDFKKSNLYGIEQDPLIATLAIVNMIFRGDGSSNIAEGDCLNKEIKIKPNKVLMNPPFALKNQFEWQFVDRALEIMQDDGILFTILPTTTMGGGDNKRKEITWRKQVIKQHTLIAVVKLAEDLFYPHVSKGTYGVVIKPNRPHDIENDDVIWAVHKDGIVRTKTNSADKANTEQIVRAIGNYLSTKTKPKYIPMELDCCPIGELAGKHYDFSPENYIGEMTYTNIGRVDFISVLKSIEDGNRLREHEGSLREPIKIVNCKPVRLMDLICDCKKGKSGRSKNLNVGKLPLISTSEQNNGISCFVDERSVNMVYCPGKITISSNGGACFASYHEYKFGANGDVFVLTLRPEYRSRSFGVFLCSAINSESWRFNYFRKFSKSKLEKFRVKIPYNKDGEVDLAQIERLIDNQVTI